MWDHIQRMQWGIKWLLGTNRGGRNFGILTDDTFIVSYPRSGNTWTRFLIANLVYPEEVATFANIEWKVPDTCKNTRNQLRSVARPRIVKSHEYFDPRYGKVLYIVRDPRDVVVSYYHFHRKKKVIEDGYPMDVYVSRFIAGDLDEYGSWKDNVVSWLATREGTRNFLLLRYEDLLENPSRELSKIAAFLGLSRTCAEVTRAVALSSAEEMRKLEARQGDVWVNTKNTRMDIPFVRSATSGRWKSSLPPELATEIESVWGPTMRVLGYSLLGDLHKSVGTCQATGSDLAAL
jgi:hypothetical protein